MKYKEKDVQKQILEWLTIKKIFHYRNNSGAVISEYKGRQRFIRYGATGSPDIICVIEGRYIGLEVKGTGGKQSDGQKEFQKKLEEAGGKYIIAYTLEDAIHATNSTEA